MFEALLEPDQAHYLPSRLVATCRLLWVGDVLVIACCIGQHRGECKTCLKLRLQVDRLQADFSSLLDTSRQLPVVSPGAGSTYRHTLMAEMAPSRIVMLLLLLGTLLCAQAKPGKQHALRHNYCASIVQRMQCVL